MSPVATFDALSVHLGQFDRVAIAVSGGIDSLTLSAIAVRTLKHRAELYHATSPAVPPDGTARVRELAKRERAHLSIIDAHEFAREDYVTNPANRCFFCKQSLYTAIAMHTEAQILSGTNADDLADYRPGLEAARLARVRHPFAELGIRKPEVRATARALGLGELAELPASPCLSSRVETGIAIRAEVLAMIHEAEVLLRTQLAATTVRCRLRRTGIVIEVDEASLTGLTDEQKSALGANVRRIFRSLSLGQPTFAPYSMGSAFLRRSNDRARHPT